MFRSDVAQGRQLSLLQGQPVSGGWVYSPKIMFHLLGALQRADCSPRWAPTQQICQAAPQIAAYLSTSLTGV